MDDFVNDMEEDILDDEQLNDMIPDTPQPPKQQVRQQPQKKNIYQEQIKKPVRNVNQQNNQQQYNHQNYRQPSRMQPSHNRQEEETRNIPDEKNIETKTDKLKSMVNLNTLKLPILVFILYVILTIPILSDMLGTYVPVLKPGIVSTIIKGVLLALIVLVMNKLFKN